MGKICCDTRSIDNIVQCQFGDERRGLEEEGQWLLRSAMLSNLESTQQTCPIPPEAPATTKCHQYHSNISFLPSANIPALIPIIAASAMIEFCPTNVNIYPALSPIASMHQDPTYLKWKVLDIAKN
jgi:hypothetical protein